jgi:hypothetical protein
MAVERYDGFVLVRLRGEPYELGLQHGVALRQEIWSLWRACERLILQARGRARGWAIRQVLLAVARVMERYVPADLRREMRGVADGSGLAYGNVLLLNCFDDLMNNLRVVDRLAARLACSAFAAVGERAGDGSVIAGRNLDYWFRSDFAAAGYEPTVQLQRHVVVLVYEPARGQPFVSVGWPGLVNVVTAQNAAGLALACLTSPAWSERPWGTPMPFLYRHLAQHVSTLDAAEAYLRAARRTIGNNLLVASGAERGARMFELTSRQVVVRAPEDGVVAATNQFQSPALAADQAGLVTHSSPLRLARLDGLLPGRPCRMLVVAPAQRRHDLQRRVRAGCGAAVGACRRPREPPVPADRGAGRPAASSPECRPPASSGDGLTQRGPFDQAGTRRVASGDDC